MAVEGEREALQHWAAGEQMVEVPGAHDGVPNVELQEVGEDVGAAGEARGGREIPVADEEAAESGAAEDVGGEGHIEVVDGNVDEDEVLHALGGDEARPLGELGTVEREHAVLDVDDAEGARVTGEGAADGRDARGLAGGEEEIGVAEDERRGAPDAPPAGGERRGASRVLDGEAGDDVAEKVVGERADAVLAAVALGGGKRGAVSGGGMAGEPPQDLPDDVAHAAGEG
ncbi:Os01g0596425, partial [Oryza sativa Japonica Group]